MLTLMGIFPRILPLEPYITLVRMVADGRTKRDAPITLSYMRVFWECNSSTVNNRS